MARVIECIAGHYEARQEELGISYQWRPESVMVECKCGEKLDLKASATTCDECGSDHASTLREGLAARRMGDETLHPWRYDNLTGREDGGIPY